MSKSIVSDFFNPEILVEAVQGEFAQKTAFMGSILVSQGAVTVDGSMPESSPGAIGSTIRVPYFGTLGEFVSNADGNAVTPSKLAQTTETATVSRDSLAFEISRWAQGNADVDPNVGDPYEEAARQIQVAATRAMDKAIVTEMAGTPLVSDVHSSSSPVTMNWDVMVDAMSLWGDEQDDIVAMVVHSRTKSDMLKLRDSKGNTLLVPRMNQGDFDRFAGVPILVSDRVPLTGSTMGDVTSAGSTPPVLTLGGTPLGPWNLRLEIVSGTAFGTATFRFSTDGGNTWSATMTTPAHSTATPLVDTAVDSLVGVNGQTGITISFADDTTNADNVWTSKAQLKVRSMILKRNAGAFWYNRQALGLETDKDILAHTDIAAMHLYRAAHRYRRVRGGTKPGVISIAHNVSGF